MVMRMLFVLLCLPAFSTARAGPTDAEPGLKALLDKQTAQVGDRVVLSLSYVLPEGAGLMEPPEIKGVEDLTLVDVQKGRRGASPFISR